jgi:autotransporter-associated beta strand protein
MGSLAKLKMPAASMVLNGGTLRHTGAGNPQTLNDAARLFTIGALGATLDSATPGETFAIGFRYDFAPVLASPAGGRLTLTGEGDGVLDYSVPGTGGVTKSGPGTWTMTGTNNTYKGSTIVEEGTLTLNHAKAVDLFDGDHPDQRGVEPQLRRNQRDRRIAARQCFAAARTLRRRELSRARSSGSGTLLVTGVPPAPSAELLPSAATRCHCLGPRLAQAGSFQVQTNSLTTGLGTNWFTIPGSSLVTVHQPADQSRRTRACSSGSATERCTRRRGSFWAAPPAPRAERLFPATAKTMITAVETRNQATRKRA